MRAGQREGLGADERRHHVEEQHEGHEASGGQEQHLCQSDYWEITCTSSRECLGLRARAGRGGEGKRRSRGGAGRPPRSDWLAARAPFSFGLRLRRLCVRRLPVPGLPVGPPANVVGGLQTVAFGFTDFVLC